MLKTRAGQYNTANLSNLSQASDLRSASPLPEPTSIQTTSISDDIPVSAEGPQQTVVYSAQSDIRNPRKLFADMLADAYSGRALAWRLFLRNIRGMYRQTFLGLFWAFLPPIANTAIWIFLRQQGVFNTGEMVVDATLYILTGMVLWQAFSDGLQMPQNILSRNKNMLTKLRFSREALLLVGVGEIAFDLAIRTLLLVLAFAWFGVAPGVAWLAAIVAVAMMVVLSVSIGIVLMPLGSLYQDVGRLLAMAMPFWMILTPIIYVPPTTFPGTLLLWINPASPFLILARDLLLTGESTAWMPALVWLLVTVPLAIFSLVVFRVSMPVLIERMNA